MENLGYYNGKFGPLEEMMVPMNDRVCYFGDGVYDATYSRNGVIFALDEHIDRFFNSAGLLRIELPCTKDEMKDILNDMVSKVDSGNNFVYWQAEPESATMRSPKRARPTFGSQSSPQRSRIFLSALSS